MEKDKFTHINEGNSKYFDHIQNYLSYFYKVGNLPKEMKPMLTQALGADIYSDFVSAKT